METETVTLTPRRSKMIPPQGIHVITKNEQNSSTLIVSKPKAIKRVQSTCIPADMNMNLLQCQKENDPRI